MASKGSLRRQAGVPGEREQPSFRTIRIATSRCAGVVSGGKQ